MCLARVASTNVLVVIVAHRYGWEPEEQSGEERKSITWLECEQAVQHGREVLALLLGDAVKVWPEQHREHFELCQAMATEEADAQLLQKTNRRIQRLNAFKAWLNGRAIRKTFVSREDLAARWSPRCAPGATGILSPPRPRFRMSL